ncbi:hypothetical protein SNE40_020319 [Patella caerulea]|uniref:E3 ubiquitin-protein ligase parkin n=2 Tax=Patella caerulea TaxID=87958 RepID=A0AAN8G7B0_PATCE
MFSAVFNKLSSRVMSNMLMLNIRYNCNNITSVTVNPECTVGELKKILIDKVGNIPERELGIILGGHLLEDDTVIQDCNLGAQSTLHAYRQKLHNVVRQVGCIKCQYYVYCKICKSLKPGKLRVKCSTCHEGAFVADRGPDGWHDILEGQRISGTCQNESCHHGNKAAFYLKCAVNHDENTDGTAVGLHHIRPNSRQVACIGCTQIQSPVLVYPCQDGHVTCLECFKIYCIVKLNERKFEEDEKYGYTLPCPVRCDNSLIQESHHFCLLGEEQYERYKRFGVEEFVLKDGGLLCPAIGCGNAVYPPESRNQTRSLKCPLCQFEFCIDCRCGSHEGDCSLQPIAGANSDDDDLVDRERAERARWESQTLETIRRTTKQCPKCRTQTEKNGGCSHMNCSRCDYEWCWMCEIEWNTDCQGDHWFD